MQYGYTVTDNRYRKHRTFARYVHTSTLSLVETGVMTHVSASRSFDEWRWQHVVFVAFNYRRTIGSMEYSK
jgi:hypothetical protein